MKKALKALTIAAAFTFVQGVYVGNPTDAAALNYVLPPWDLTIIDSSAFSYANYVQATTYSSIVGVNNFSLPASQTSFFATGLQVTGNSVLSGLLNVSDFLSAGTVTFNGLAPTLITGNAASNVPDTSWIIIGGTVAPAPRPRRDADFATVIDGILTLTNLTVSWNESSTAANIDMVGLVVAKGGMIGDLMSGTVSAGWSLRKTTVGAVNASGNTAVLMSMALDPTLADSTEIIVAERNAPVPEPSTVLLLGGGLAGLAIAGIRRRRNAAEK